MRNSFASSCFLIRKRRLFFIAILYFIVYSAQAQYYEEKPDSEIGIGVKIVKGQITYGPKSFYKTDNRSIGFQALVRFDIPMKLYSLSPYQQRYLDFVVESGFLYCKANAFDSVYRDPITNIVTQEKSKNPTYFPIYLGIYSRNKISLGAELFYWKGLGTKDIWGTKFISLGYNAQNFRISCSSEWYSQINIPRHNGLLFSVDFLWKLIVSD